MRAYVLPLLFTLFGLLSTMMLSSIYPSGINTQVFSFILGGVIYAGASSLPFAFWKHISGGLFIFICVVLLFTLVLGKTTNGSTRWVNVGSMQFQPSQLAKPLLGLYLCTLLTKSFKKSERKKVVFFAALSMLSIGLVFLQPDLGTALILTTVFAASLYFSGVPLRILAGLATIAIIFAICGWSFILRDYQKQRLTSFLAPAEDQLGQGYHADQAVIAVGSGKLLGRGLGHGVQSSLRFLPERQTDFLFASYAEELGFFGVMLLFILYIALFVSLFWMAHHTVDKTGKAFAYTIISMIFIQAAMNIGMNLGLLPIAGVTLPLMSLGGSSVMSILFALGVMASAYQANPRRHLVEIRSFV